METLKSGKVEIRVGTRGSGSRCGELDRDAGSRIETRGVGSRRGESDQDVGSWIEM